MLEYCSMQQPGKNSEKYSYLVKSYFNIIILLSCNMWVLEHFSSVATVVSESIFAN